MSKYVKASAVGVSLGTLWTSPCALVCEQWINENIVTKSRPGISVNNLTLATGNT